MADVGAASQATVAGSGILIQMQVVRTERDRVRYQPLQPYQERTSIAKRCRVWQQMLVFFVRT
jgi:adenylosuccinate synthase